MTDKVAPSRIASVAQLHTTAEPEKIVGWYCTNCGTIYSTLEEARRCGRRYSPTPGAKNCSDWTCQKCGQPAFAAYQSYCAMCLQGRQRVQEDRRLHAAPLVDPYPDDRPVFYDGEFYDSLDDLIETFEDDGAEPPSRVWAAKGVALQIDLRETIEAIFEADQVDADDIEIEALPGFAELEQAVSTFNAKQEVNWWQPGDSAVAVQQTPESDLSSLPNLKLVHKCVMHILCAPEAEDAQDYTLEAIELAKEIVASLEPDTEDSDD